MKTLSLFSAAFCLLELTLYTSVGHADSGPALKARQDAVLEAERHFETRWNEVVSLANLSKKRVLERAVTLKDCEFINAQHARLLRDLKVERATVLHELRAAGRVPLGTHQLAAKLAGVSSRPFLEGAIARHLYSEPGFKKEIALLALGWAVDDLKGQLELTCLTHDLEHLLQQERELNDQGLPATSTRDLNKRFRSIVDEPAACAYGLSSL